MKWYKMTRQDIREIEYYNSRFNLMDSRDIQEIQAKVV